MTKYIYAPKQLIVSPIGKVFELPATIVTAINQEETTGPKLKVSGDTPVTYTIESNLSKEELFEKINEVGIEKYLDKLKIV